MMNKKNIMATLLLLASGSVAVSMQSKKTPKGAKPAPAPAEAETPMTPAQKNLEAVKAKAKAAGLTHGQLKTVLDRARSDRSEDFQRFADQMVAAINDKNQKEALVKFMAAAQDLAAEEAGAIRNVAKRIPDEVKARMVQVQKHFEAVKAKAKAAGLTHGQLKTVLDRAKSDTREQFADFADQMLAAIDKNKQEALRNFMAAAQDLVRTEKLQAESTREPEMDEFSHRPELSPKRIRRPESIIGDDLPGSETTLPQTPKQRAKNAQQRQEQLQREHHDLFAEQDDLGLNNLFGEEKSGRNAIDADFNAEFPTNINKLARAELEHINETIKHLNTVIYKNSTYTRFTDNAQKQAARKQATEDIEKLQARAENIRQQLLSSAPQKQHPNLGHLGKHKKSTRRK